MVEVKNSKFVHLYCFPLNVEKDMKTLAEVKCFQLVWLKCCYDGTFTDVYITKKDRLRINLPWRSYIRGLELLEKSGLIVVDRHNGRSNRITVNIEKIDSKSKNSVLNNKKEQGGV